MELRDRVEAALEEAKRRAREEGGTVEGWLWYLLMPEGLLGDEKTVIVEFCGPSCEWIERYIIDKRSYKIIKVEYEDAAAEDWGD